MTQDEMQKLWEALSLIYGRSLQDSWWKCLDSGS